MSINLGPGWLIWVASRKGPIAYKSPDRPTDMHGKPLSCLAAHPLTPEQFRISLEDLKREFPYETNQSNP